MNVKYILIVVFVFALIVMLYSWLQISPFIYNDFKKQCDSNGGVSCMGFYWKQKDYFVLILKISIGMMVASGLGIVGRKYIIKND